MGTKRRPKSPKKFPWGPKSPKGDRFGKIKGCLELFRKFIRFGGLRLTEGTAPTLSGDPKYFSWGPNGDLILSEMGTQWGPSTAEMGTQKAYI